MSAPVSAAPAVEAMVAPVHAPAMTAEAVTALANEVCACFARAEVARAMAGHAASDAEHAHLSARAAHWDAIVKDRWPALVEAIHAALPDGAQLERFMPVRPLANGHVEVHAHDTSARRLVLLLSGAQAVAVGTHLTVYGAVSLDRIGQKLDPGLPVTAVPPFAATNPAGPPTDTDSPTAAHP